MLRRTSSRLLPALALVLVAPALTSCGLFGLGGDDLDDALELVPDTATQVTFRDREAIAERLGVDDVEQGADQADLARYAEALAGDTTGPDELTGFVASMQDSVLSELSVRWSVSALLPDGPFTAYKVDDDVDLDDVADDLAGNGFAEDELDGRRHLVLAAGSGEVTGAYPSTWIEVTVDPDEHLLVTGPAESLLQVLDDDIASFQDDDTFDDLLADTSDVEYAVITNPPTCAVGATPEQLATGDVDALGTPERTAFLVSGDDADLTARLELADDDAAQDDLDARRTHLEGGTLATSGEQVASLGTFDLERKGAVVRIDLGLAQPAAGRLVAETQDGFLACTPPPADETDTEAPPTAPSSTPSPTPDVPTATATADTTATAPTDDATVPLP